MPQGFFLLLIFKNVQGNNRKAFKLKLNFLSNRCFVLHSNIFIMN